MACRFGPPTDFSHPSACGRVMYAVAAPSRKSTKALATNGTAYRRSVALRPGVTKRQIWNRMIGDARTRPPKRAIFTRSDNPSRGEVTNRLQLPFDATKSDEDPLGVWCPVEASTLHSGCKRKCSIGS